MFFFPRPHGMETTVATLLDKLVFPESKPPVRYDDDASATPTAAQTLTQEITLNWAAAVTDRAIPQTDMMVFLFKDPLRSVIFYQFNQSSATFFYDIKNPLTGDNGFPIGDCTSGYWLPGDKAVAQAGYQPHSAILYPADCNGMSGYWCDNDGTRTSKLSIELDNAATIVGGCVEWYVWSGNSWNWYARDEFVNATAVYKMTADPPLGGAYMAAVVNGVIGMTATQVTHYVLDGGTGPSTWSHYPCPQIDQLLPMIQGHRVTASSLRWLNLSSTLEESGKVNAVTVAPGLPWSSIATSATRLTLLQGYRPLVAKKGYYGFTRPTDAQLQWQYNIQTGALAGSTLTPSRFKVNPEAPYIAVAMSVASTNARNTSITVTHMIEYMTNSKAQETRLPDQITENAEVWEHAIRMLARTENHMHADMRLSDLFFVPNKRLKA